MKNFHLLLLAFVFICGIVLAAFSVFASFHSGFLVFTAVILFIPLVLLRKRDILFVTLLVCLVFLFGAIRYNIFNRVDESDVKNIYLQPSGGRKAVLLQGKVASDPEESRTGKKISFILEAGCIKKESGAEQARGFVLVNAYDKKVFSYKYGDIIALRGFPGEPFSFIKEQKFDYKKYLENKRIYSVLNVKKGFFSEKISEDKSLAARAIRSIYFMRGKTEAHIKNYLKPPHDSILIAILLGKRRGIPREITDLFAKTGTLHILAISGLHVGIIYFALKIILKILRVKKSLSVILIVLFLACFAVMTGARASILRAATMFSILALGELLKRKTGVFNLIGLSCLIILMINPNQAFDVGFILSYTAVLSIVGIPPLFYRIFSGRYLLKPILISAAVYIGIIPLSAYYFGLISPIAVVANLIVIPLLSMIMASGLLLVTLGSLFTFMGVIFSESVWAFLTMLINSVKFLKSVPFSYFEVKAPAAWAIIIYYLVICGIVIIERSYPLKNKS